MKKIIIRFFKFMKMLISEAMKANIAKYSASLAYYTILALAPLLIIILNIFGIIFGREAVSGELYGQIKELVGDDAALQIQHTIQNIHLDKHNFFATMAGIVILLISATGIFNEMQDSLNRVWGLRLKAKKVWWKILIDRLISFSLILSMGFVLVVSLALNALVSVLSGKIIAAFPALEKTLLFTVDNVIGFIISTILFGTIFKMLPDAKIKWKDVLVGAMVTAVLFGVGRSLIGLYLGKSQTASIYGAAGSVIIIMLWAYYSSIILYFGAVFTKVYVAGSGRHIYPNEYAVWVKTEEIPVPDVPLDT